MKSIFLTISLLVIITQCSSDEDEENINVKKQKILDDLLDPKVYDKRVRPNGSEPTNITISIGVVDVIDMDQYLKDFTIQCYFIQKWKDERLQYGEEDEHVRRIRSTETDKIWKPDLFFTNEIKGSMHDLMVPNRFFHLEPDGRVRLSNRVSVILSCHTNLMFYPHDEQKCYMSIESYSHLSDELSLHWDEDNAVNFSKKLSSDSKYILIGHNLKIGNFPLNDTKFSYLHLELHFSRNSHAFVTSVYLPHIALVILSFASFCIDHKKVTLRLIYLGLILFLILRLIPTDRDPDLQITALDIWITACVLFVLFCFLESIFVHQASDQEDSEMAKDVDAEQQDMNSGHMNEEKKEKKSDLTKENKILARLTRKYPSRSKRIDVICRTASPMLFLLFNIIYWSVSCSASKYV